MLVAWLIKGRGEGVVVRETLVVGVIETAGVADEERLGLAVGERDAEREAEKPRE